MSLSPTPDGLTLILEGVINGASAWEVIKRLEACERSGYPVTLDFKGVTDVHWFAAQVLTAGLEYISKAKGPIRFMLPDGAVEQFNPGMLRPDFWKVARWSPDAFRRQAEAPDGTGVKTEEDRG